MSDSAVSVEPEVAAGTRSEATDGSVATVEETIVMKFGGSSVADLDRLREVAAKIVERAKDHRVVVVVSAMGKTTDGLVRQANALSAEPSSRELDMLLTTGERQSMAILAMAIQSLGQPAISLTGSQAGIITTHRHGRARIVEVRPFRVQDELSAGQVVVVGGFQGVSYKREVTTLGRGGSDTTAVALAAALGANCEIYSDVDGVYSSDPRQVEGVQRLEEITFEEMRALSRAGAKVLHAQAVQLAEDADISIFARATDGRPGESVVRRHPAPKPAVRAIACDRRVLFVELEAAAPLDCLRGLAALGFIDLHQRGDARGGSVEGRSSLTQRDDHQSVHEGLRKLEAGCTRLDRREWAVLSCVGTGLEDQPEVLALALESLAEAGVEVHRVMSDTLSLAFAVDAEKADAGAQSLHARLIG